MARERRASNLSQTIRLLATRCNDLPWRIATRPRLHRRGLPPAVDGDVLAADHVGCGRDQEQHEAGDVLRLDPLLEALVLEDPVIVLTEPIAEDALFRLRHHRARRDRVDPDAMRA